MQQRVMPTVIGVLLISLTATLAAAEGDYPSWMGPDGSRSSDAGLQLVDHESKARVLWKSEVILPKVYADPSKGSAFPISHYCAPVVVDDLVYYVYPDPSQSAPLDEVMIEKARLGKQSGGTLSDEMRQVLERGCRQAADDLIICIDANTGKTVWTRRFAEKGANPLYNTTYHATPVIADGRCYVLGSLAMVYCLDAKTGATIWESELADSRAFWQEQFALWKAGPYLKSLEDLRSGAIKGYKEHYVLYGANYPSPVLAEGVLVCADMGGFSRKTKPRMPVTKKGALALVGLDAKTGKQLWRTPCGATGAPKLWRRKDGASVISVVTGGHVCVDVKTGAVQWRSKGPNPSGWGTHLVVGDVLVNPNGSKKPKKGATAYRLSLTGMTEMWSLSDGASYSTPAAYKGHVFLRGPGDPGAIRCVELATGKVVATQEHIQGNICNSIIIADDRLWYGWNAYLMADPASPDLLKHLGKYDRDSEFHRNGWASPTVSQGRVFYRRGNGSGPLYCADYRAR